MLEKLCFNEFNFLNSSSLKNYNLVSSIIFITTEFNKLQNRDKRKSYVGGFSKTSSWTSKKVDPNRDSSTLIQRSYVVLHQQNYELNV